METLCSSLYVKLESSMTPRSLPALAGSSSFPNRNSLTLTVICRLPNITNSEYLTSPYSSLLSPCADRGVEVTQVVCLQKGGH